MVSNDEMWSVCEQVVLIQVIFTPATSPPILSYVKLYYISLCIEITSTIELEE